MADPVDPLEANPFADPYSPDRITTRGPTDAEARRSQLAGAFRSVSPFFRPLDPLPDHPGRSLIDDLVLTSRQRAGPPRPWQELGAGGIDKSIFRPNDFSGSVLDAFLGGIRNDSIFGLMSRHHEAVAQRDAEMGAESALPKAGYDPFHDPQLAEMKDQMWRFYDSQSPGETRLRMIQLVQAGERERAMAANNLPEAPLLAMAGSVIADPTNLVPISFGVTKTVQLVRAAQVAAALGAVRRPAMLWGVMGAAVEGAAINAAVATSAMALTAHLDAAESLEGLGQVLMISAGLGALAGGLTNIAKGAHHFEVKPPKPPDNKFKPETLSPDLPESKQVQTLEGRVSADSYTTGHVVTDANGTRWQVIETEDGKGFKHVKGPVFEEPVPAGAGAADEVALVEGGQRLDDELAQGEKAKATADLPLSKEQIVAHPQRGWLGGEAETGVPAGKDVSEITPRQSMPAAEPKPILDSAPPHPVEGSGDNSMARSVSAAVVPGMATSNLKNLLHAESLAPAGGLEKLGVAPGFRNVARRSYVVKTVTMRLSSTGGVKQNKNVVGKLKIPMETPAQVLRDRAAVETTMNANLQGIIQIEVRLSKAAGMAPGHPDYIDIAGIRALEANKRALETLVESDRLKLRDPGAISRATGQLADLQRDLQATSERLALGNDSPDVLLGLEQRVSGLRQAVDDMEARVNDDDLALATGYQQGDKSVVSVEDKAATRWTPVITIGEQAIRGAWVKARVAIAGQTITPQAAAGVGRSFLMQAGDMINRTDSTLKLGAFRERVTKAHADGADRINDAMTPYVTEAAMALHKAFEDVRTQADSPGVDLFRKDAEKSLAKLEERRAAYLEKQKKLDEDPHPGVMGQFSHIERILKETIKNGPHQSNSRNYVPTIYRQDKVAADYDGLVAIHSKWIVDSNKSAGIDIPKGDADRAARAAVDKIAGTKAQSLQDHADELFEEIDSPSGAQARTSTIPRHLIEDYLENDAILLLRYHVSSMGRAIEMTREFGDINMTRQLQDIADDYKRMIDEEPDPRKRIELLRERDGALEDTQTLRDRVLGIEGASKDPHSWSERTIRQLKHYMAWTNMGMSAISQMADFPRTVLTEGLDATFRYGFGTLIDKSRRIIMDMATAERLHAGDIFELSTASGSMSMANIGDTMNSRSGLERISNQLTGMYFLANGLTWMTEMTRKWATLSIQGNMNAAIMAWGKAIADGRAFTDEKTIAKFLNLGMDGNDIFRIYRQMDQHGVQFKSIRMANTMSWADDDMTALYRQALRRQMDRTVLTADSFGRPSFMSKSVGSLITQFKTFGVVSYQKTLVAGLQDNDRQFWLGMATLTGAGILLNEIRNQIFYDRSTFDQPYLGVLVDGIDRAGVLGSVMDVNNAIEAATRNKIGLRPMVGAPKQGPVTPEAMMNTFLGPSAGKAALGAKLLGDYMSGDATARTWRESRGFIPGQNLPYLDWWMDMMFPQGKQPPMNKPLGMTPRQLEKARERAPA